MKNIVFAVSLLQATILIVLPNESSPQECLLPSDGNYMNFVVRVMKGRRQKFGLATGSIISPIAVLTVCQPLLGLRPHVLRVIATVHGFNMSTGPIKPDHGPIGNSEGNCSQERAVKDIIRHKLCDEIHVHQWDLYNTAVLILKDTFKPMSERVPIMPVNTDLFEAMAEIDRFNALRRLRCHAPIFTSPTGPATYEPDTAFRSVPFHTECYPNVCEGEYPDKPPNKLREDCIRNMTFNFGYVVCGKRVKQATPGITFWDEKLVDVDLHPGDKECNAAWAFGAPLICDHTVIGMITGCSRQYYLFTTTLMLRHTIGIYADMASPADAVFMDVNSPPRKHTPYGGLSPKPRPNRLFAVIAIIIFNVVN